MRIAMLAPPWLPIPPVGYGGLENVIHALVPELLKSDVEVELFTIGDSTVPATGKHFLYESGQYEHIHKPYYDSLPITIAHMLDALRAIREDGKFDIIHDHNPYIGPAIFAYVCEGLPPVIHTLHGPPFTTPDRLEMGIPDNLPMWRQFKDVNRLYFVPISQALANGAPKEMAKHMLPVVHNSVNVCDFPFVAQKQDYFMTLARFNEDKGQHIAVEACLDLGYSLKMAGAVGGIGNPGKVLMELANPLSKYRSLNDFRYFSDKVFPYLLDGQIENIGDISGKRKMDMIGNSRALLFPIQWEEPFGMAAIEAMACGTPVVAMNRGAMPEIIDHGVNGFLAKNKTEFKKYMQQIDQIDPQACRDSVERKFSAQVLAKNYLKLYKRIAQKHSS
jgi:glycosyltransferase involved in cell wall biosynthesis